DADATRELGRSLLALSTEHGFQQYVVTGRILDASIQVEHRRGEAAIARLRQNIGEYRAMGNELYVPYYLALLAAAHLKHGEADEGRGVTEEALRGADATAARLWDAELCRLKGELLLARDPVDMPGAEVAFRQAIEIAGRQSARSWELRAVTSLGRLLGRQGSQDEVRRMLVDVYGWFTEGFDT